MLCRPPVPSLLLLLLLPEPLLGGGGGLEGRGHHLADGRLGAGAAGRQAGGQGALLIYNLDDPMQFPQKIHFKNPHQVRHLLLQRRVLAPRSPAEVLLELPHAVVKGLGKKDFYLYNCRFVGFFNFFFKKITCILSSMTP